MKKTLFIVTLLAFAVILSGCGKKTVEKKAETAIEDATGGQADVDIDKNSMTINTDAGSLQIGDTASIPADFPDDVHVADGTVKTAMQLTENDGFSLSLESSDSVADLKTEYENNLASDGWETTMSLELQGVVTMSAEKDDRIVSVIISETDGMTTVGINTSTLEE